jgi:secreted trypsin-like serine protease
MLILITIGSSFYAQSARGAAPDPTTPQPTPTDQEPANNISIVGGTLAATGQSPWEVAMIDRTVGDNYWGYICGGTLISPEWVVTAAHCVYPLFGGSSPYPPSQVDILLGTNRLSSGSATKIHTQQILPNPGWDDVDNDIALIHLSQPAQLGSLIQTIPMVTPADSTLVAPGVSATVSGWGVTDNCGFFCLWEDDLRVVNVPIVSNATCQQAYNDMGWTITSNMICAGSDGKDACDLDSGSPMVVPNGVSGYKLAGIVSFGHQDGCGATGKYGGYTRVSQYVNWVNSITGLGTVYKSFLSIVFK